MDGLLAILILMLVRVAIPAALLLAIGTAVERLRKPGL